MKLDELILQYIKKHPLWSMFFTLCGVWFLIIILAAWEDDD